MWHLILESNLINFIVVFVIMAFIIKKINVGDKIENVRKTIKSYVDESSNEKEAAEKELSQIQAKIEHLQDDIKDIETTAQNNIKGFENKIQEEIYEKKKDIDKNAERILNLETKNFKDKLSSVLSEASINLARKNAIEQLKNNRELHNKYINEALEGIDKINL
jgi:F0F1-type ATP synthase membrane subunit b/b'